MQATVNPEWRRERRGTTNSLRESANESAAGIEPAECKFDWNQFSFICGAVIDKQKFGQAAVYGRHFQDHAFQPDAQMLSDLELLHRNS